MKTTAIWVLRHLLIPVGFIWATGIITGIIEMDSNSKKYKDPMKTFSPEELATLEFSPKNAYNYGDSVIAERKAHIKKTGVYDPYLYYRDLKQYYMFEQVYGDSLNKTTEGRFIMMNCVSGIMSQNGIEKLVQIRDENWRDVDVDALALQNYTQHSGYMRKIMSVDEAKRYWFQAEAARELASAKEPPTPFWSVVGPWLIRVYLRGMLIAFFLFLIWKMNLKRDFEEETWQKTITVYSAPLSFIISLLIWPVILCIDIRNRWKEVLGKAEVISRRNIMLGLLSEQEQKLLEIGKSMKLREFRKYLDSIGVERKHSIALSLCVLVLLFLVPQMALPQAVTTEMKASTVIVTNMDYGGHISSDRTVQNWIYSPPLLEEPMQVPFTRLITIIFSFTDIFYESDFSPDISKVPLVVNQLRIQPIDLHTKKPKYEKTNSYYSRSISLLHSTGTN